MATLPLFLQALADTTASDPAAGVSEAQLGAMLIPALGLPTGATVTVRVLVQLTSLTAANVVTFRLRRTSISGPVILAFTVSAAGTVVQAAGSLESVGGELLFLTGQITTGSGTAALAMASVLLEGIPQEPRLPPARPALADDIFGIDFDVLSDLPPSMPLARGLRNLGNAILRRLWTPAGFLAEAFEGDADYGYDVRGRLNSAMSFAQLAAVEAFVSDQCRLDERVRRARVRARFSLATKALQLALSLDTALGPFRLILSVSAVRIEVLRAE